MMKYRLTTFLLIITLAVLAVFTGRTAYRNSLIKAKHSILSDRYEAILISEKLLYERLDGATSGIGLLKSLAFDDDSLNRVMDELSNFDSAYIGCKQSGFDEYPDIKLHSFFESNPSHGPRIPNNKINSVQLLIDEKTSKLIDLLSHEGELNMVLPPRTPPTIEYFFLDASKKYFLVLPTGFRESSSAGKLRQSVDKTNE